MCFIGTNVSVLFSDVMYLKKTWCSFGDLLRDHVLIASQLPSIALAYVGSHSIEPSITEAIMLTMNSVNNCGYCTGLHGELGRMSGIPVDTCKKLNSAKSLEETTAAMDQPHVLYSRKFALKDGKDMSSENTTLDNKLGKGSSASVQALCWFLHWGSFGGNTINAFPSRVSGNKKEGSSLLLEVFMILYYGPLYIVIVVVSGLLSVLPVVPPIINKFLGLVLTVVAGTWIAPIGLIGGLFKLVGMV